MISPSRILENTKYTNAEKLLLLSLREGDARSYREIGKSIGADVGYTYRLMQRLISKGAVTREDGVVHIQNL